MPPVGTPEYAALRERDADRRAGADAALAALVGSGESSPADLYRAAGLLQQGNAAADARRAHELASEAARRRRHLPAERAELDVPPIAVQVDAPRS